MSIKYFKEWFMRVGWMIFLIVIIIGATVYYSVVVIPSMYPISSYTCNVLDNNGKVYPGVIDSKVILEKQLGLKILDINGSYARPLMNDSEGVTCVVPIYACTEDYLYCINMDMVVGVNYTKWSAWYNETK